MRITAEYLARAVEFDSLAARATISSLVTRYSGMADWYRLLAVERKQLIATGEIKPDAVQGQ
jgi:hypothetical protein